MTVARLRGLLVFVCACGSNHGTFSTSDETDPDASTSSDDASPVLTTPSDAGSGGGAFMSNDAAPPVADTNLSFTSCGTVVPDMPPK